MQGKSQSCPYKQINTIEKHQFFLSSQSYKDIILYITSLQSSVKSNIEQYNKNHINNKNILIFYNFLEKANQLLDENPPLHQENQRFGNKVFRIWYEKLLSYYDNEFSIQINEISYDESKISHPLSVELRPYFQEAFGNSSRIDYGTGHELNFILILMILSNIGIFQCEDYIFLVKILFKRYIQLIYRLLNDYKLEPAGSKGVYGLDDYFFLIFLFSSAELIDNKKSIEPVLLQKEKSIIEELAKEYSFFEVCYYNLQSKKGELSANSPILYQISNVTKWEKIANGLVKMWEDQLLKSFVVCQHINFGDILKFK